MVLGTTMDTGSTVTNEPAAGPQAARLIPRSPSRYLVTGTVLLVSAGGARAGLPYFTVWPPLLKGATLRTPVRRRSSIGVIRVYTTVDGVWRRHN